MNKNRIAAFTACWMFLLFLLFVWDIVWYADKLDAHLPMNFLEHAIHSVTVIIDWPLAVTVLLVGDRIITPVTLFLLWTITAFFWGFATNFLVSFITGRRTKKYIAKPA